MFKTSKQEKLAHKRAEHLMQLMEEAKDAAATLTGIKQQFIDNGWSEVGAEQAVIVLLQQNVGK